MTRATASIVLSVLLVGCASVPVTRYYVLDPRGSTAARAEGASIGVLPFVVDAPYDQDRIVYRVGDASPEVGFYDYHRWAVPLGRMLPRLVAAALGDVQGVARVEPIVPDRTYDLRLIGRVRTLEEVDTAAGQHVHVGIDLALVGPDGSTVWSTRIDGRTDDSADTVAGLVEETRDLMERLLDERRDAFRAAVVETRGTTR